MSGPQVVPDHLPALQRLFLAFVAFFAVLFRREFAERVWRLRQEMRAALPPAAAREHGEAAAIPAAPERAPGPSGPEPAAPAARPRPVPAAAAARKEDARPALQLLALLQREGRLVDFIEESLDGFSDAQIGAAARTVHAGCKRAIEEHFRIEPVYLEAEGAIITVATGFDPGAIRLTGNVVGQPPFRGSLRHHGWRVREAHLPSIPEGQDPHLVAPAEVEL
jgi:uncharacterized protein DUF2760